MLSEHVNFTLKNKAKFYRKVPQKGSVLGFGSLDLKKLYNKLSIVQIEQAMQVPL